MAASEREFVRALAARMPRSAAVRVGIGDDAAVLGDGLLVACDMVMDGTHFRLEECGPARAGRKALAVNLSDIAAMGGRPEAAFVALALPAGGPAGMADALMDGLAALAARHGVAVAGGDTNSWEGPLAVAVTVTGRPGPRGPLLRSGARGGDVLAVTGALGGSRAGRHLDFEPRLAEAEALAAAGEVHALLDISDGLALDLARMAEASGVGARLEAARVPVSAEARGAARSSGRTPLDHALGDGEDFELLAALPLATWEAVRRTGLPGGTPLTRVGEVTPLAQGLVLVRPDGGGEPLEVRGWQHRVP
ncbi:MAG: thiamine-monophosphate kinase [Planctomycetes bacterium]|nr:thiamine-monophosphate kinase [Planctomycetota bacterium]